MSMSIGMRGSVLALAVSLVAGCTLLPDDRDERHEIGPKPDIELARLAGEQAIRAELPRARSVDVSFGSDTLRSAYHLPLRPEVGAWELLANVRVVHADGARPVDEPWSVFIRLGAVVAIQQPERFGALGPCSLVEPPIRLHASR